MAKNYSLKKKSKNSRTNSKSRSKIYSKSIKKKKSKIRKRINKKKSLRRKNMRGGLLSEPKGEGDCQSGFLGVGGLPDGKLTIKKPADLLVQLVSPKEKKDQDKKGKGYVEFTVSPAVTQGDGYNPDIPAVSNNGRYSLCTNLKTVVFDENFSKSFSKIQTYKSILRKGGGEPEYKDVSGTEIPQYCFYGCENLETIIIPTGVEKIGTGAFYDCKNLTTITIPNTVNTISSVAFKGCTGLSQNTMDKIALKIPPSKPAYIEHESPDAYEKRTKYQENLNEWESSEGRKIKIIQFK
jgi:hypothetical protein